MDEVALWRYRPLARRWWRRRRNAIIAAVIVAAIGLSACAGPSPHKTATTPTTTTKSPQPTTYAERAAVQRPQYRRQRPTRCGGGCAAGSVYVTDEDNTRVVKLAAG
jgi:hypothetical protein